MEFTEDVYKSYFNDAIFLDELNTYIKKILIDNFKLSNVSKSIHYKILHYLITCYFIFDIDKISIAELKKKLNISRKKLERAINDLAIYGFVKVVGNVVALGGKIINNIFNLIQVVQNFDKLANAILESLDGEDIRLSDLKKVARRFLENSKLLSYFEKSLIYSLFNMYLERANSLRIFLKKKDSDLKNIINDLDENKKSDDLLILEYKTRFNNEKIIKKHIVKLKNIIKEATKYYQYALFITLTTNPHKKNILEGYKEISKAFKKFRDAISRRIGEQIKYVKVLEFTKTGLPHLHILIFVNSIKDKKGDWVLSQKWISDLWSKYGFGEITYIYALKRQGNTYTWLNFKPAKAKTNNIANYLSKYLEKAFKNDLELMYYWVSNLRFYTYSYSLYKEQKEYKSEKLWEFLGAWEIDNIENLIEKLKELYYNIKKVIKRRCNNIYNNVYGKYWSWLGRDEWITV